MTIQDGHVLNQFDIAATVNIFSCHNKNDTKKGNLLSLVIQIGPP